mgnify:CR=1 FL=1
MLANKMSNEAISSNGERRERQWGRGESRVVVVAVVLVEVK